MALEYPDDLKYLDSHEYVRLEGTTATLGISAFAVDQLGDIVFLDLPEVGATVTQGETFGTVESVKAVEDMYSAVSGTVIDRNEAMINEPEKLAEDPYEAGWLLKISLAEESPIADNLFSAAEYRSRVAGE
ncbi:MAG: glycine cleavage system protein GcvH [Coleofasciculaceae cyanobacterium SM2_1_6]|nr:glycine cleavage system protein GcvH [Coleofasciculaceae cyanobacterium SM2_1_6]